MPDTTYQTFMTNTETGVTEEVTSGQYFTADELNRRRQAAEAAREREIRQAANSDQVQRYGHFTWFRYEYLVSDFKNLSPLQIARLFYAATCLPYNGCKLTHGNGNALTSSGLQKKLSLSDSAYRRFIKEAKEGQYMQDSGDTIAIDSALFARQPIRSWCDDGIPFIRIYHETYRYLFEHLTPRKQGTLGYLIKLIPFINAGNNIVCSNPDVENIEQINPINMQEICRVVGYTPNQASRLQKDLEGLRLPNGQAAFQYVCDRDIAVINPLLFYAGTRWDAILDEFFSST